jgi:glycosyltransferase involved in cell wall biosynthesis
MGGSGTVAVVIPTLDEEESIAAVVRALPRDIVSRVIVADGGSRDATAERAGAAGADVIAPGRGYGRACLAGAWAASDADITVFMDGDGADDPAAIAALVAPIRAGTHDFVIASRACGPREPGSIGWHQLLAGRLAGLSMRLLYGVRYTDMCAFRAIRRDRLLALGMREMTYGWNIEMQMRAARARLRILEIPVPYRRRIGGTSKVAGSLAGTLRAGWRIVATFVRVARPSNLIAGEAGRAPALPLPLPEVGPARLRHQNDAQVGQARPAWERVGVRGAIRESGVRGETPSSRPSPPEGGEGAQTHGQAARERDA